MIHELYFAIANVGIIITGGCVMLSVIAHKPPQPPEEDIW